MLLLSISAVHQGSEINSRSVMLWGPEIYMDSYSHRMVVGENRFYMERRCALWQSSECAS